ncbi:50S ribosomal protein L2 [Striga asiatica]|uniref:50S ribosomal protein L2 n=1 Tax=Striga asiatica TaxID=4170 RepID=A0A5A7QG18_STRAF|nr:50S ribosomal protein L2 [Striga asiatica]
MDAFVGKGAFVFPQSMIRIRPFASLFADNRKPSLGLKLTHTPPGKAAWHLRITKNEPKIQAGMTRRMKAQIGPYHLKLSHGGYQDVEVGDGMTTLKTETDLSKEIPEETDAIRVELETGPGGLAAKSAGNSSTIQENGVS